MIKFPYGIADFHKLITEEYLYIDRTDRIRFLEDTGSTLLFLRPRRFGKSLLLSTLENYYDVAKANEFERLFGHLAIGKDPTPKHNQYFILKWDFSSVIIGEDEDTFQSALYDHINGSIERFQSHYKGILDYNITFSPNALRTFQSLLAAIETTPYKLYLLIDEYDNFANSVLMTDRTTGAARYRALLQSEGILKTVFKAVKSALGGLGLDRVFLTGVAPVVLSDAGSSFNMVEDISLYPEVYDLCGFREDELYHLAQQVGNTCNLSQADVDHAMTTMRTYYNGYSFTYNTPPNIYNSTLAVYFLKYWQRSCEYPIEMLDENLSLDQEKFVYIASIVGSKEVLVQALNGTEPVEATRLSKRFGVSDMLKETQDTDTIIRLLYYFGILTLTGTHTDMGDIVLTIPNLVIKQLYIERIRAALFPTEPESKAAHKVARDFYRTGDVGAACRFIEQTYFPLFDNRDYCWTNELTFKTMFMVLLANDTFYTLDSETALQREYSDLIMIVRSNQRHLPLLDFVLEFKYVSLQNVKLSGEQVRALSDAEVTALPKVQTLLAEAQRKLAGYRQTLLATSPVGEQMRLRCYSVLAVGYERFVWQEGDEG